VSALFKKPEGLLVPFAVKLALGFVLAFVLHFLDNFCHRTSFERLLCLIV